MVFNCPDRDIKPDRDLFLRQTPHFAKYEDFCALGRQCCNRTREKTNALPTIDNIINRGLTAIF
jgi:hypothetical protein